MVSGDLEVDLFRPISSLCVYADVVGISYNKRNSVDDPFAATRLVVVLDHRHLAKRYFEFAFRQDAQELTTEWLGSVWHRLRAQLLLAILDWVVDIFRFLLHSLERLLYAVDEWLRFHNRENWLSIMAKAILGVIWSFCSFLIRIYVNLLIEPTFHPVKHFPVVTVAHKIFLPALIMLEGNMVHFLGQYLGTPLARSVTWFNIFFLPGFFGFAVWELKENWRLFRANRKPRILPIAVGKSWRDSCKVASTRISFRYFAKDLSQAARIGGARSQFFVVSCSDVRPANSCIMSS